jgi:DNA-binding XRE family transcriptional regulator
VAIVCNLKNILDNRGIKQTWLADKVNVHRGTLNNIILNKYNTSLEVALKIAKALDMKVDDIFKLIDEN